MDRRTARYTVINHEEQYSLWPNGQALPKGWRVTGREGSKEECLAYIEEVWTDVRADQPQRVRDGLLPR
jgi:MbtH protein